MLNTIPQKLLTAHSVILSTHRHCDGDGLGAQIALFHALKGLGKDVRILNVDKPGDKYAYLGCDRLVEVFDPSRHFPSLAADVAIVLDTNDHRLLEPLFSRLKEVCGEVLYIDHHPILLHGPAPTHGSLIDTTAASTGEIVFRLLKAMEVPMSAAIARALYTSVVFDTQLFRFVKSDPRSHLMAAELLKFEKNPEDVHRQLFATYTTEKLQFVAKTLTKVEYFGDGLLALIHVDGAEMKRLGLDLDESADIVDLVMNIETVEAAALIREDGPTACKLSLRSKGTLQVLALAENHGGGGHVFAAGAYINKNYLFIRDQIISDLEIALAKLARSRLA
jgi:phosphoesterase RecJ-like protein